MSSRPLTQAQRDQVEAATRDQREFLQRASEIMGTLVEGAPPALDRFVAKLQARARAGRLRYCPHIGAAAQSRRPVMVAMWAPDVVVCRWCRPPEASSQLEDRTCDLCRRETTDGIHPAMAQLGPFIVLFGACTACRYLEIHERGDAP